MNGMMKYKHCTTGVTPVPLSWSILTILCVNFTLYQLLLLIICNVKSTWRGYTREQLAYCTGGLVLHCSELGNVCIISTSCDTSVPQNTKLTQKFPTSDCWSAPAMSIATHATHQADPDQHVYLSLSLPDKLV